MSGMTRKEFFRATLGRVCGVFSGEAGRSGFPESDPALAALAADFPDALLHDEARRLGLDPARAGREEMLRAVVAAMLPAAASRVD